MPRRKDSASSYAAVAQEAQPERLCQPSPRECAMLLLRLIEKKKEDSNKDITRARLAEITLRRLWVRSRLSPRFLEEVEEWLAHAGWAFFFARSSYAIVKIDSVEGWGRISSKSMAGDIKMVSRGKFHFDELEHLLVDYLQGGTEDDE
jgi:hypothetical protein